MRARGTRLGAGLAGALVAGTLALSACGPTVPGGGAAPATSSATSAATTAPTAAATPTTEATTSAGPTAAPPAVTPLPTTEATTSAPNPVPPPPAYLLTSGATGDQVRQLQARLRQLEWYDGDVSGSYDERTTAGVRGFQDKRGMPASGSVDQATWDTLTKMTRTPTDDELHNRLTPGPALLKQGATGDKVRDLQARLKQIGWWSGDTTGTYDAATAAAVKAFQTKRSIPVTGEVDQRTLDKLTGMTRQPTGDELNNVKPTPTATPAPAPPSNVDARCLTGRTLCISKATRSLTWMIDGQPKLKLDVRFGDENNPTREGLFSVYIKERDWTSTLYGSKMPYSMFFSGGEAVHYSSDFAARGYNGASHGCVNVRDLAGIAWLFDQVRLGDRVVVY